MDELCIARRTTDDTGHSSWTWKIVSPHWSPSNFALELADS